MTPPLKPTGRWFRKRKNRSEKPWCPQELVLPAELEEVLHYLDRRPAHSGSAGSHLVRGGDQDMKPLSCPFCEPDKTVLENGLAFVKYDIYPVTEGHLLIIPKRPGNHLSGHGKASRRYVQGDRRRS